MIYEFQPYADFENCNFCSTWNLYVEVDRTWRVEDWKTFTQTWSSEFEPG